MDKFKNIHNIVNVAIFVLTALITGFGSAWLVLENGSRLTSTIDGQWRSWHMAGRPDADPYARAHVARTGRMPVSSANIQYFIAKTDSQGLRLLGTCEYVIENSGTMNDWWSLSAFDDNGMLQKNNAQRYAFNSSTILRDTNGKFQIHLSAFPRPRNWLPTNLNNKVTLMFRLHAPVASGHTALSNTKRASLPTIRRVACG